MGLHESGQPRDAAEVHAPPEAEGGRSQDPARRRTPHVRSRARDCRQSEFVWNEAEDLPVPAVVSNRIRDPRSKERDPERAHGELDALVLHGVTNPEATGKRGPAGVPAGPGRYADSAPVRARR